MESESEWCGSSSEFDFSFAFNDPKFSDRVLRIEIMSHPDTVKDCSAAATVVSVQTLHISSPILAAKSTFFHKLFSNGMRESEQRHVTLKINASEEVSLMALLNFMYTNTLNNITTAAPALVDVIVAADKFRVSSCMKYCCQLLLNSPMTPNSASLYLDLPHSVLMADAVQPLADAANKYLMALPRIETILASHDLHEEVMPLVMESECSCGGSSSSSDCDFGFAFNDSNFSNKVLRIEIMSDAVVRVKSLHISSPILAAKSHFFYKLFTNGTEHRHATLRINASEEVAFMELLNFMYSNTLNITAAPALRDVLMAADKYGVSSCMRYCSRLPMTPDFALLYLELPHTVLMSDAVQPLTDAAKEYLAGRYKDIIKFWEEVMAFPLYGIEAILASDDLQVTSEDVVYDFVLKWARKHYNKPKERRQVLCTRLACLIRFPYMTSKMLMEVLSHGDFTHEDVSELVHEALIFKAEGPYHRWSLAAKEPRFVQRAYKYRSIKVVKFEVPRQWCVVYLDLKREECASLFPSGQLWSQAFHLGEQRYFLSAQCNMDKHGSFHCFELFVAMKKNGPEGFALVEYEFAVRCKPTEEFVVSKKKAKRRFTRGDMFGPRNLFATPWTSFMADDSPFFINGVLHLKAELTIRH